MSFLFRCIFESLCLEKWSASEMHFKFFFTLSVSFFIYKCSHAWHDFAHDSDHTNAEQLICKISIYCGNEIHVIFMLIHMHSRAMLKEIIMHAEFRLLHFNTTCVRSL